MATKLKDLELTEVSCVKAGANPGAKILLAKAADPVIPAKYKVGKAGVRYDTEMSLTSRIEDVGEAVKAKYYGNGNTYVHVKQVFDDTVIFCASEPGMMDEETYRASYSYEKDSVTLGERVQVKVVYEDAGEQAEKFKFRAEKAKSKKGASMEAITQEVLQAEITKALGAQQSEFAKLLEAEKSARVDLEKRATEAAARADAAELVAKAEREERKLGEHIATAKSKYGALPGEDARKGALLKSIADHLPEADATEVLKLLDSGNAAMVQLMHPGGKIVKAASGGNAEQQINELAKDLAKANGVPFSKAYATVLEQHPELYAQYKDEKQGVN